MKCNSCGGIIGLDCFNPSECAEITRDIESRTQERVADIDSRVRHLEVDIGEIQVNTIAALHRIWTNSNPPRFEWSESAPTSEGWFWMLRGESAKIVHVARHRGFKDQLWVSIRPEGMLPVEKITNSLWAGPIPQPTEP